MYVYIYLVKRTEVCLTWQRLKRVTAGLTSEVRKLFLLVSPYQQVDGKCSSFEQTGARLQAFDLC